MGWLGEEKELGKVSYTKLGFEDHGILTFVIGFDFGGHGQGFGTYCLDTFKNQNVCELGKRELIFKAAAIEGIKRVLKAFGVNLWEELVGKTAWVERNKDGYISTIEAPDFIKHHGKFNIRKYYDDIKNHSSTQTASKEES